MRFVPVQLGSANRTIGQPNCRDSFHLAPLACSVLSIEAPTISHSAPGRYDLDTLNSADQLKPHLPELSEFAVNRKTVLQFDPDES